MNNFLETLRQLGPARLAVMAGVVLMLLLFFSFVSFRVTAPDMKMLYTDLTTIDSSAIAAKLEEAGIKYEVSPDGTKVTVPENEVGRARMLLAQAGLPGGGSLGYEIFDKQSGFGTTNFVQNINQVRALEGELARTINAMDPVRSTRVHLVLPQRDIFSRDARPASASVFIGLRPGAKLSAQQIAAIQSLVGSAVPGLETGKVSIVDDSGNLLARGDGSDETVLSNKAEELRRSYEARMTQAIEELLGRTVGFGRVQANVTADLNFDRISTNEELYDPEGQVVRSTQVSGEKSQEKAAPSEEVSVQTNLPGEDGASGDTNMTQQSDRTEETTNYEISKTVRSLVREVGEVRRLSVAVLVDGTYTTDKEGKKVYQPRSDQEIKQIEALVKGAIGFDAKRGDTIQVSNMPFAEIDAPEQADDTKLFGFEKADLLDSGEILVVTVAVILVVLLILQPMVGRLLSMAPSGGSGESGIGGSAQDMLPRRPDSPALTGPGQSASGGSIEFGGHREEESMIDMQQVEGKVKASSIKKVEEFVESYPNETVSVLRSWMSQDS